MGYVYILIEDYLVGDGYCRRNNTGDQFLDKNVQHLTSFGCDALFHIFSSTRPPLEAFFRYPGGIIGM